jgi:hypothetical protein
MAEGEATAINWEHPGYATWVSTISLMEILVGTIAALPLLAFVSCWRSAFSSGPSMGWEEILGSTTACCRGTMTPF